MPTSIQPGPLEVIKPYETSLFLHHYTQPNTNGGFLYRNLLYSFTRPFWRVVRAPRDKQAADSTSMHLSVARALNRPACS